MGILRFSGIETEEMVINFVGFAKGILKGFCHAGK
jgi:hypothetical protein